MTDKRGIVLPPDEGPSGKPHRRAGTADAPFRDDAYAVVIGINTYVDPRIPDLRYARADAELVYQVLTDPEIGRFKRDNVRLLVDEQATQRRIQSEIGTLLPKRASSDATVCIYYAGHGAPFMDPASRSADGMEKYLIPHDAEADDLRASAISMELVQRWFTWIKASQVLFFLDSCYSGVAGGRSFELPGFQPRAMLSDEFLEHLGDEGRFVVTACDTNEVSLETPTFGHGIFTYYLVEGMKGAADLDGNGLVTIDELYDYVYRNVNRAARELGGSMSPIRKGSVRGTVYLTQYETQQQKRVRENISAATAASDRGALDEAAALLEEALRLDPGNTAVRLSLSALTERRAEAARRHEEEERQRTEVRERKQRVLLKHKAELPIREFNQAMDLLEQDLRELSGKPKEIREFVDHLVDGEITVARYRHMVGLVMTRPSGAQGPPEPPVDPEAVRREAEARDRQAKEVAARKVKEAADREAASRQEEEPWMNVLRAEAVRLAEISRKAREEAKRSEGDAEELVDGGEPRRWESGILRWLPFLAIAHSYLVVGGMTFWIPIDGWLGIGSPLGGTALVLMSVRVKIWQGVVLGLLSPLMLATAASGPGEGFLIALVGRSIVPLTVVMCGWTLWLLRRRGKGPTALTAPRVLLALAAPPLLYLALSFVLQGQGQGQDPKLEVQEADTTSMMAPAVQDSIKR